MSSTSLCKKFEGAGSPIFVQALEDGIADSVGAFDDDEGDHSPSAGTDFHEAPHDDIWWCAGCARDGERSRISSATPTASHRPSPRRSPACEPSPNCSTSCHPVASMLHVRVNGLDRHRQPRLPRRDSVQKLSSNQHYHYFRPRLKSLHSRRPKTLIARLRQA